MKTNIGSLDRALRVAVGLFLITLALLGVIGPWGYLGVLVVATGVFRYCPAYAVFGVQTGCASGERRSE